MIVSRRKSQATDACDAWQPTPRRRGEFCSTSPSSIPRWCPAPIAAAFYLRWETDISNSANTRPGLAVCTTLRIGNEVCQGSVFTLPTAKPVYSSGGETTLCCSYPDPNLGLKWAVCCMNHSFSNHLWDDRNQLRREPVGGAQ